MVSKPGLKILELTRFLDANRPSPAEAGKGRFPLRLKTL
jgi:hypothetical protein